MVCAIIADMLCLALLCVTASWDTPMLLQAASSNRDATRCIDCRVEWSTLIGEKTQVEEQRWIRDDLSRFRLVSKRFSVKPEGRELIEIEEFLFDGEAFYTIRSSPRAAATNHVQDLRLDLNSAGVMLKTYVVVRDGWHRNNTALLRRHPRDLILSQFATGLSLFEDDVEYVRSIKEQATEAVVTVRDSTNKMRFESTLDLEKDGSVTRVWVNSPQKGVVILCDASYQRINGVWFPNEGSMQYWTGNDDSDAPEQAWQFKVSECAINDPVSESAFDFQYLDGYQVRDMRFESTYFVGAEKRLTEGVLKLAAAAEQDTVKLRKAKRSLLPVTVVNVVATTIALTLTCYAARNLHFYTK